MRIAHISLAAVLVAAPVAAQDPPESNAPITLGVNVDLVELHVTVADERERPVGGLKQDNFKILEDGIQQAVKVFKHEDVPVSLGLVLDNSRSIEPRKERLDAAALAFVRSSNTDDEAFVVHFDFDARLTQAFTREAPKLEAALRSASPFGQTAIYDGLALALEQMGKAQNPRKAILLVTDGLDNVSKTALEDVLDRVKRSRVSVYVVGLLSQTEGARAESTLVRIAQESGGRAYFPANVDEARLTMETVARDLREQYTLAYLPSNASRDGAWRSVRVEVTLPKGLNRASANYRHGYYGPE